MLNTKDEVLLYSSHHIFIFGSMCIEALHIGVIGTFEQKILLQKIMIVILDLQTISHSFR